MANNLQYPALSLYPYNDTFIPKHIYLSGRVKIGRQTNAKTAPGERNGYFDSKVLSRQHAEVWEENGKVYIKDVKSSNGTFVNGDRLSAEGVESEPAELKTNDIVEFGIDIVGDDNKTIIHHKVSARVVCILSAEDAMHEQQQMAAASANAHQHPHQNAQGFGQQGQHPAARRPTLQPSLGGMGGPTRPRSSISFDHVLIRLQGELSRSRDTTTELHGLTEAMNDISDALGGAVPPPPLPASLPPVRPSASEPAPGDASSNANGSANANGAASAANSTVYSTAEVANLHSQLTDTRTSLANHAEKVREIEGMMVEHESMKRELAMLRELMEARERREMDASGGRGLQSIPEVEEDDDDARSVRTIVPGDEEDERERAERAEMVGRPGTPEPGMRMADEDPHPRNGVDDSRLNALMAQLENAIELSKSLAAQHTVAQETIRQLEDRVKKLGGIEDRVVQLESAVRSVQESPASGEHSEFETRILDLIGGWKHELDGRWNGMQEGWEEERRRLNDAKQEFEKRVGGLEEGFGSLRMRVDSLHVQSVAAATFVAGAHGVGGVGTGREIRHGLVTPPSPRSMSVDSQRRRKPRSRVKRQQSRDSLSDSDAPSRIASGGLDAVGVGDGGIRVKTEEEDSSTTTGTTGSGTRGSSKRASTRSDSSSPPSSTTFEDELQDVLNRAGKLHIPPLTPESSMLREKHPQSTTTGSRQMIELTPSTVLGCVIVGAAAAAVYWRTHE